MYKKNVQRVQVIIFNILYSTMPEHSNNLFRQKLHQANFKVNTAKFCHFFCQSVKKFELGGVGFGRMFIPPG